MNVKSTILKKKKLSKFDERINLSVVPNGENITVVEKARTSLELKREFSKRDYFAFIQFLFYLAHSP